MASFMDQLKNTLDNGETNVSVTENGAVGYRTTGKKLLDLNFSVSSLRNATDAEISARFADACAENIDLAILWLFYARDARKGLGERRLFRICMIRLATEVPEKARRILPLVSEYGRWDDLWCLFGTQLQNNVLAIVKVQLMKDLKARREGKPVSLLAKWLPSENASSADTAAKARVVMDYLSLSPKRYRTMLSALRKTLKITERQMSANEWGEISYPAVPSRANLLYGDAFLRHDEQRRRKFLEKVRFGEKKINASVLFPHDIVRKYSVGRWSGTAVDDTLEALWKALPNVVTEGVNDTIVVADGSGSMWAPVGGGKSLRAMDVANALAIYFAERLNGPYKNRYITFSEHPQFVDLSGSTTLVGKIQTALAHDECANTNIESVFRLILTTALSNHLKQDELPRNVLIISDMEFDGCVRDKDDRHVNSTLFTVMRNLFAEHGYKLPRLVFWNVCSRTGTIPIKENDLGVALVSGFSPNTAKMVMSAKLDPWECLMETLNDERYEAVRKALSGE